MKPWVVIVVVIAALALGLWLLAPQQPSAPGGPVTSQATDEKFATISTGQRVDIEPHLKDGRFTVVEFTADW